MDKKSNQLKNKNDIFSVKKTVLIVDDEEINRDILSNILMDALINAYEAKDYQTVFNNAHALKGVTGNLALTSLYEISSIICEATRNNPHPDIDKEIDTLKERYSLIINCYQNG